MLKLSDVQAQPWLWRHGDQRYWMRPLSLSTFASAELYGCGLDDLLSEDETERVHAWCTLFSFLAQLDPSDGLNQHLLANPEAFGAFIRHVESTLSGDTPEPPAPTSHRRNKDPRQKIGTPDGPTMKKNEGSATDYAVLFDLARYARLSLTDLYQMTLRGLMVLSRHLAENPPVPNPMTGQID